LIGWSELDLWYYGVRFSVKAHPHELWTSYFTSSRFVSEARAKYGEPDVVQIRRRFADPEKARLWEAKVLQRLGAARSPRWLNRTDHVAIFNEVSPTLGKRWTPEERAKHSLRLKGLRHRRRTPEQCLAQSLRLRGRKDRPEVVAARAARQRGRKYPPRSAESRARTSAALKGKKRSPAAIENMRRARKGVLQRKVTCPTCGTEGGLSAMTRYHFQNCKLSL
jgi:hypothetical protein